MARPDRSLKVHNCIFYAQIDLAKKAINLISQKEDSLNENDIQAIQAITESCQISIDALEGKYQYEQVIGTYDRENHESSIN